MNTPTLRIAARGLEERQSSPGSTLRRLEHHAALQQPVPQGMNHGTRETMKNLHRVPAEPEGQIKTHNDFDALVRRSSELSIELSRRCLTSEDVRWGARIALAALAENGPLLSTLRLRTRPRLRTRIRRLAGFK